MQKQNPSSPLKNCKRPPLPDLADPFSPVAPPLLLPPPPLPPPTPFPEPLDGGELQSEDPEEADDGDEWFTMLPFVLLLLLLLMLLLVRCLDEDWSESVRLGSPIFDPSW